MKPLESLRLQVFGFLLLAKQVTAESSPKSPGLFQRRRTLTSIPHALLGKDPN